MALDCFEYALQAGGSVEAKEPWHAPAGAVEQRAMHSGKQRVIVQHAARHTLTESYDALHRTRVLKQGDNALSFYEPVMADSPGRPA